MAAKKNGEKNAKSGKNCNQVGNICPEKCFSTKFRLSSIDIEQAGLHLADRRDTTVKPVKGKKVSVAFQ